ncbi:MAG: prolyl oligopeptidase family serine peptidase [Candidatus Zipacnadales bacterium]
MYGMFAALMLLSGAALSQKVQLQSEIQELTRAIEHAEEAVTDRQSLVYLSNMPLARFKLRKAIAQARAPLEGPSEARKTLAEGWAALENLKAGRVALEGETGHLERAYITCNDHTAQPYYVYVSEDYNPNQPWPLIVFLHGYVLDTTILKPWVLDESKEALAAQYGALLLTPYGRRNTDFQGVGEVDVLQAIAEMQRFYNIDPDRIYLCGPSMGGYGTWTISLRYPGLFAACAPMCGQTDMFVWWPWPYLTAPAFKKFLGEWDNPIHLAPNAVGQNYLLQHGEFDRKPLIPVEQSHMMVWELKQLGTPIEYFEHEGEDHFIYLYKPAFERAFPWLLQHKLDRWPKHVRLKSYTYRYDTAFWLRILEYERWGKPGFVEALVEGNRINLTTDNVARLSINSPNKVIGGQGTVEIVANGKMVLQSTGKEEALEVRLAESQPPRGVLRKKKGLCGPVEDVFNGPFVLVMGTAGTDEERVQLNERVSRWAMEWDAFADGFPPVMRDSEVTEEVMAQYNLVLFGTPETNSVLGQIADRLPVRFLDDGYALGDQTYTGPDLGLVLCYPNPEAPEHYVLVYSGEDPGRDLGVNHKHDLLPDYFIFRATEDTYPYDQMFPHLCAGFFDLNWQLDPDLMETNADMVERHFGSVTTIRDRTLDRPVVKVKNGYAEPLYISIDNLPEVTLKPGEFVEQTLETGRHHFAARCPDGVTRTEVRLLVPEFRYEWRIPPLYAVGWP